MSSIRKKLTLLFFLAALLALERLAAASPSGSQDVLKLTIVGDTDANKALAWL